MKLKRKKYYFTIISLILLEVIIIIYSLNKGASNTDEFTTLLHLRYQKHLIVVDFYNMLYIVSDIFFNEISILSLRLTKYLFITLSVSITCLLLFPVLIKKYQLKTEKLLLIGFILMTGSVITVFNRSICYNDIMDHFSVMAICILFNLIVLPFHWIRILLLSILYLICSFFLTGIKLPLGIISILIYIITVYKFLPITPLKKTTTILFAIGSYIFIEYCYIVLFYGNIQRWTDTLISLKNIFYGEDLPIYLIDVISFTVLFLFILCFQEKIGNLTSTRLLKLTRNNYSIVIFLLLFSTSWFFYFSFIKNPVLYVLYYLIPAVILDSILIYIYCGAIIVLYKKRKTPDLNNSENYTILLTTIFFISCILGSYTLQLINISLHTYFTAFIIIILLIKANNQFLLKPLSAYLLILFLAYSLFNPFLYSNTTIFSQNKKVYFKSSNEHILVDSATKNYFLKINSVIGSKNTNECVINIDYSNVIYYLDYIPYILPNIVDEQSATIFHKEIIAANKLKSFKNNPAWVLTSNSINPDFYKYLEKDLKISRNKLILRVENPSKNIFKNSTDDGFLYIYTINKSAN